MPVNDSYIEAMNVALDQARDALNHDDVPVGAVVLHDGKRHSVVGAEGREQFDATIIEHQRRSAEISDGYVLLTIGIIPTKLKC